MKKVLLSLLLAITCMPVFAQIDAAPIVVPVNVTRCTPFTWDVTGETYANDTVLMVRHTVGANDTVYVLNLVVDSTNIGRKDTAVSAKCVYIWRDSLVWDTAGTYTVTIADPDGCDSIYTVDLTLTSNYDSAMVGKKTVCGKYMSPWGELFTQDTIIDTAYITDKGCNRRDSLILTVNPTYEMPLVTAEAACSYYWEAIRDSIFDNEVHREVLKTKGPQCDSIVSIQVNMSFHIDTLYDTVVCDMWVAPWDSLGRAPYSVTDTVVHRDTSATQCVFTTSVALTVNNSFIDTAYAAAHINDTTIGCYLQWGDTLINTITTDSVLRRIQGIRANKCDSVAAVRVIALNYMEHVDSSVTPCAQPFKWRPYSPALYTYNESGTYYDTNIVGTGATACTTYYSLNLTFSDSVVVRERPRRCEYDSIKIGTPRYSFRIENGDTIVRKFTGSGRNTVIDTIGMDEIYQYNTSSRCTTYYDIRLNIIQPNVTNYLDSTVTCDRYACAPLNNMLFTSTVDTTIVKATRPQKATYPGTNNHSIGDCADKSYHLKITIHTSDTIHDIIDTCDQYHWAFNDTTYNRNVNITRKSSDTTADGCAVYGNLSLNIRKTPVSYINGDWRLEPGGTTTLTATSSESNLSYTWYKNGVSDGTGTTYTVTDDGSHENVDVMLTAANGNGCPDSNWLTIVFAPIGIDDVNIVDVSIYPNPASRIVNLRTNEAINTVTIYNAIGQQVMLRQGEGETMQIDLYNLASGHYTMRIRTAEGHEAIRKFIVNK